MTPEEKAAEIKRVDEAVAGNQARVRARRKREADEAAKKKAEAAKIPQPTAAGRAMLNAPSGFQALVNVLGKKPEQKKN